LLSTNRQFERRIPAEISLVYLVGKVYQVSRATVGRWGKSLAVRLPGEVARSAGFRDGERVEVETRDGDIVIRHAAASFELKELFKGKTPKEWRALYSRAFDWGPDRGREIIED
jgi:antitoxin component of MazEF toxin-antitoxin module